MVSKEVKYFRLELRGGEHSVNCKSLISGLLQLTAPPKRRKETRSRALWIPIFSPSTSTCKMLCYSPFFFSCSLSSFAVAVDSFQKSIEFKTLPWKSKRRTRRAIRGHNFLLVPRNDIFRCYVVAGILRIILIQIGGRTSAKSKIICLEQVFPTSFQPTKL